MPSEPLTVGSICAGVGGLDIAMENLGFQVKWQIEIDEWRRGILERDWPNAKRHEDVTTVNYDELERVDCITSGFPCQPWSYAGKQRGTEDERWIWDDIARGIRTLQPSIIFLENVPGLLRGGIEHVIRALAENGYDAECD